MSRREDPYEIIRRLTQPKPKPEAQTTALAKAVIGNLVERALEGAEQVMLKEETYTLRYPDGSVENGVRRQVDIKRKPATEVASQSASGFR